VRESFSDGKRKTFLCLLQNALRKEDEKGKKKFVLIENFRADENSKNKN
jgi:hypothetical protein